MPSSRKTAVRRFRATLEKAQPQRIVLHAGRVKTGSTFLQSAMIANAATLAQAGWLFPESLFHISNIQSNARGLRSPGHAILPQFGSNRPIDLSPLAHLQTEIDNRIGLSLLFSAENLGWDARQGRLSKIAPFFEGFDVEILIYLRRPSEWINSYYFELVTGGHARLEFTFESVVQELITASDAYGFLRDLEHWNTAPNMRFRNYDLARQSEGGLLGDFCQTIGLPKVTKPTRHTINDSPSFAVCRAIRVFNALTRGLPGKKYNTLYTELLERLAPLDDGHRKSFLTPQDAAEIDTEWARRNIMLVEGGYISRKDYDALTAPKEQEPFAPPDPAVEAHLLLEVCAVLQENGITGFAMPPTVAGVGGELRRRIGEGLRRRLHRTLTK